MAEPGGWPAHSSVQPQVRQIPVQFTGSASEYFRIWIINTLLTIVTLGIYSAWAKVRTKQYFYRNTLIEGTSFEYLANPIQVLKGRLIAAAALGALFGSQHYSPILYGVILLLLVLASPWVLVKALAFNARNSAFRNIRFAFTGRVGEAAGLYLLMMLFNVVTCGLAYPYAQWRFTEFVVTRHLYGDQRFAWGSKPSAYFVVYLITLAMIIPAYIVLGVVMFALIRGGNPQDLQSSTSLVYGLMVVLYAYLLVPGAYVQSKLANLLYGGTQIGPHQLSCNQRTLDLLGIYVVNLLGIVVSLGLLIPWAKIRLARYRASCLTLLATGPLAAEKLLDEQATAVGEGLSDLGDFDIGIGV
jgi:uncharacterized membrane protein YjgN (DUF898 family)